jgi:tRNA threonylcarbamoyladenosine biosynthesis protein TsaE
MPLHESHSVEETERIAADFARSLWRGALVALHGEMGAGKTHFVRGMVRGLGGDERQVSSPTFVLLNVYNAPSMSIYHLDAYRVGGADDFQAIGFEELLDQDGIVVVEWPERVAELLLPTTVHVMIEATGTTSREITIADCGRV